MKTLGLEPFIHPTARVHESALGRYRKWVRAAMSHARAWATIPIASRIPRSLMRQSASSPISPPMCASMPASTRWSAPRCTISPTVRPGISRANTCRAARSAQGAGAAGYRRDAAMGADAVGRPAAARGDCPGADAGSRRSSLTSPFASLDPRNAQIVMDSLRVSMPRASPSSPTCPMTDVPLSPASETLLRHYRGQVLTRRVYS